MINENDFSKLIEKVKFDKNGLVTVIAQDYNTNEVLMLAYMNEEALKRTVQTGTVTYWSRSRQKFWVKGETSGLLVLLFCCIMFFSGCSNNKSKDLNQEQEIEQNIEGNEKFQDFLLKGVEVGKKIWELKGDTALLNMENTDNVKIVNPKVFFYEKENDEKISAVVTSKEAIVNSKTKDMHAMGEVEIFSKKDNTKIFTEEVYFKSNENIFYSEAAVRVEQGENITEGIGFNAKSDLSEIHIKKDVVVRYKSQLQGT
jgi:LPS export ABC transporter protein LptC